MFKNKEVEQLNISMDIAFRKIKLLEEACTALLEAQKRTQEIEEQLLKMITTNSGRIDDVQ